MNKPMGYDKAKAYGDFVKLPKGGYICKIVKLEETTSKNGNGMIAIYLDIADGDFKNYYREKYQNDTNMQKKWKCIYRQVILDSTTKETSSGFKTFTTAVEESNAGFVVDKCWGDDFTKFFKDKYIGCIFAEKHFYDDKKQDKTFAIPKILCSVDRIKRGDFNIPADIPADNVPDTFDNFIPVNDDDDLPF